MVDDPGVSTFGLLATTGTVARGMFQRRVAQDQRVTCVPDPDRQAAVMSAIYAIARPAREDEEHRSSPHA